MQYLLEASNVNIENTLLPGIDPLPDIPISFEYMARIIIPLGGITRLTAVYDRKIETKTISVGDVVYTGTNCWALSQQHSSEKSISVVFMPNHIRFVTGKYQKAILTSNQYYHTASPPSEMLRTLLHALNMMRLDTSHDRNKKASHLVKTLLLESLNELQNDTPRIISKSERSFYLIKEYIEHNYHLQINLNSICDDLGYNTSYVSTMFKQHAGMTVKSYLEQSRMRMAREILSFSKANIANIAIQCGYSSVAYFIKVFKRIHKITPGEYRIQNA